MYVIIHDASDDVNDDDNNIDDAEEWKTKEKNY